MTQPGVGLQEENDMLTWIQEHPYLFFIAYFYTITSFNHCVIKFASYKYMNHYEDDNI